MKKQVSCAAFAIAFCLVAAIRAFACGPFFPNTLLNQGDAVVLTAPEARFRTELERMKLVATAWRALPATNHAHQTFDTELADLRAALDKNGTSALQRDALIERHRLEREKIIIFSRPEQSDADSALAGAWLREGFVLRPDPTNSARIPGPMPQLTPGLPAEFADYFRGSIAWHLGKLAEGRAAWETLLKRPSIQRQFKSTWAAFMLGKSWEEENSGRAIAHFKHVRALAQAGFADTLGLAASSLGWEARLHLRENDFTAAIDLYLEQAASGDPSAVISLRWAASSALHAPESKLRALASHPRAQRVITAYVISGGWREPAMDVDSPVREGMIRAIGQASARASIVPKPKPDWHKLKEPAMRWLEAVEAARVKDVESSEQLALAAYQGGQMERAQRWLQLARPTPAAQWLQAKLLLRDGRTGEAAALMARLVRLFPLDPALTNRTTIPGLAGSLFVSNGEFGGIDMTGQLHGEWGVFQLARRQYAESLDALLRSGHWLDAAYVAERVLTLDELKTYVDRHWPRAARLEHASPDKEPDEPRQPSVTEQIRHLLARRLARAERWSEARDYFPGEWQPKFDSLQAALKEAHKSELPEKDRAPALFEAAKITRWLGLELVGTEVEPDWHVHAGNYEYGVTVEDRKSLQSSNVLSAATSEIARATEHTVSPGVRWHYRYRASAMAWEAARWMPDNSDDTARMLCVGGSWIKHRDPKAADVFYKALVRRCRKTAIGAEADRIRWFPLLDAHGRLRPRSEQPLSPSERNALEKAAVEKLERQPEPLHAPPSDRE